MVTINPMVKGKVSEEQYKAIEEMLPHIEALHKIPQFKKYVEIGKMHLIDSRMQGIDDLIQKGIYYF
jgi:hypothetical protein